MTRQMPSVDDMLLAAEWLKEYEGDKDEIAAFKRVADWLEARAVSKGDMAIARDVAKRVGLPLKTVRAAMKKQAEG